MDLNVERWYLMEEIYGHLGVSRDTVLTWIEKMPATKIISLWEFKISEVDTWMKSGITKAGGKEKTVTYRQLFTKLNKLTTSYDAVLLSDLGAFR